MKLWGNAKPNKNSSRKLRNWAKDTGYETKGAKLFMTVLDAKIFEGILGKNVLFRTNEIVQ